MGVPDERSRAIDRLLKAAFLYLEALDRRALAGLSPAVTNAQYHAMDALAAEPGLHLIALANRLLCDKANASGIVDRLSALDLVERRPDPDDRRRISITLTPAGATVLDEARERRTVALRKALSSLDAAQGAAMEGALSQLLSLLRAEIEDRSPSRSTT